jgi:hypothetical protein
MKDAALEPEPAVAEPPLRAPVEAPSPAAAHVLGLQRAVGNRAVAQMLLAREKQTISKDVKEVTTGMDNVTWTASFDVDFDEDHKTCWATIKVRLNPDAGISEDDINYTKIGVISRFGLLWGSKFTFHEHRTVWADRDWLFRPGIEFVDSGQHLTVNLHAGAGKTNRQTWYLTLPKYNEDKTKEIPVGYAELEHAHELSHQMGLLDEYEDISVPDRKTYKDHSLMGDYANEGFRDAAVQLRHGERMASIIGSQTGKSLTARWA